MFVKSDPASGDVAISGVVDSISAGQLLDEVVALCLKRSGTTLTLDLCGVTRMTRAGVRGFVVAARLARFRGGVLHVTGASPAVAALLDSLGYAHLFRFDQMQGATAGPFYTHAVFEHH
nr:STAS domain-containing protein [Pseudosulfitobacter koreense]